MGNGVSMMIYIKVIFLLFLLLVMCSMIYAVYQTYRNTDESHAFEQQTIVRSNPATCTDLKISEIKGTERNRIAGCNADQFRERL
jgi:hypothetical protein